MKELDTMPAVRGSRRDLPENIFDGKPREIDIADLGGFPTVNALRTALRGACARRGLLAQTARATDKSLAFRAVPIPAKSGDGAKPTPRAKPASRRGRPNGAGQARRGRARATATA